MMSSPQLTAGMVGSIVGAVGAAARWFSEIMQGRAKWVAAHMVFIIVMGGFMGFMGSALAEASGYEQWGNVLSGALGASGAFGFDFFIKRVLDMTGL
jgi:predicted CDP-diglyceride synthetase/phosphatidate cytidylyltransferase